VEELLMSEEELYKALKIFNREDLTYENDKFFNDFEKYMSTMEQEKAIEVFMSTKDMIKYSKLEQEIGRLNNIINEINSIVEYWGYDKEHNDISSFRMAMKNIKDVLGSDKE
jgi:hypothetical protein